MSTNVSTQTKINHLEGISSRMVETDRLNTHLLSAGDKAKPAILFIHGNTTSSTIWEALMLELADDYYCLAPDLRGFGNTENAKHIDATRGARDWVDDLVSLTDELGISSYHVVGHSLGGFVCWSLIAKAAAQIRSATLFAPGPPMGFGGIHGKEGIPNNDDFSGSGGGIVVDAFADRIKASDRSEDDPYYSPRNAMNRLFWNEGFKADREEDFLTAMLQIHTGDKQYPGDYEESTYWPYVAPGRWGPVNAISPKYNQNGLQTLVAATEKPPILWVQGCDDKIISNQSYSGSGYQGKLGLRKGWPGVKEYPPQPFIAQIRHALHNYEVSGGNTSALFLDNCGHTPYLEHPMQSEKAILRHIKEL